MEALVATIMGVVSPYLAKGAEAFAKEAGKEAFKGVKALADRLGRWWNGDPVASAVAQNFPAAPEKYGRVLAGLLADELARDPALASELKGLVEQMGPTVNVVQKIKVAGDVTGADIGALVRGSLQVTQDVEYADTVTGISADRVGE
jgi:hypothetical protein